MANGEKVHAVKFGSVEATVWKNTGENGKTMSSISINCLYKKGDEWKRSTAFRPNELPLVALAAQEALRFLYTPKKKPEPKPTSNNDVEFFE